MFRNSAAGSTRRIRSVHVVAAGALVLAMGGSATAAAVITGKQIKDNTVTSKDIKNGSLQVKDFKASEAAKLRGPAGANGTNGATGAAGTPGAAGAAGAAGAPGASAFSPPPSGTVIKGGGILSAEVNGAAVDLRSDAPLPFTPAAPFRTTAPRNLFVGSSAFDAEVSPSHLNPTACPGTAAAPAPTSGMLCVYPVEASNFGGLFLYAGADTGVDAADSNGFYMFGDSNAAGNVTLRYVWAYKAP